MKKTVTFGRIKSTGVLDNPVLVKSLDDVQYVLLRSSESSQLWFLRN